MKLDAITMKNDEYYTPEYAITPILKYIPRRSSIWCPFDTDESNFVKLFLKNGHRVINTHIDDGFDFFNNPLQSLDSIDFIISNPPYSKKTQVLSSLFGMKKPFAMLIGIVGLFESKERFQLFKENPFEIMYFNRRISFFENFDDPLPSLNPPFSSVYVCHKMLPKSIIFEEIEAQSKNRTLRRIRRQIIDVDGLRDIP